MTKAFGPSPDANEIRANYYLEGERAYIVFSTRLDYYPECATKLPTDTVMVVQVTPKANTPLSSYEKDLSRFRVVEASSPPGIGYKGYIDEKEGIAYVTFEDSVEMIYYFASAEDRHLCPRYAEDPETFIQRRVHFNPTVDEFGVVRWNEERARLNNFGIQLQNAKKSIGYIIVYPGGNISTKTAGVRGKRALDYLLKLGKFDKSKLELIIGPRQDRFNVQLNMYPKDVAPYVRSETSTPALVKHPRPKNE
ncbi:MAG: hypothetical protein AB7J13_02660 [Pyrinomonadaceae bacterium]